MTRSRAGVASATPSGRAGPDWDASRSRCVGTRAGGLASTRARRASADGVALLLAVLGVPTEMGVVSVVAAPAHALSCHDLANARFRSQHHAVHWAYRYYRAGC